MAGIRIGILTFHRAHNFGAVLQAYALQKTVSLEHDAEIIDYRSSFIERLYYPGKSIKSMIRRHLDYLLHFRDMKTKKRKMHNFCAFIDKYLIKSKQQYNNDNLFSLSP